MRRQIGVGATALARRVSAVLALPGVLPAALFSQTALAIREADQCLDPAWRIESVYRFGSEPEVGLSFPLDIMAQRPDGGMATFNPFVGQVFLFDRSGRLERAVGRQGEGPGEFMRVTVMRFLANGEFETFDAASAQRNRFGPPPQHALVTATRFPVMLSSRSTLFLPDGRLITNQQISGSGSTGLPIHLLEGDGTVRRSFGKEPPGARRVAWPLTRVLAWAGTSTQEVWSGHVHDYRLERWGLDGTLRQAIQRHVPWYPPWMLDAPLSPTQPLPTMMTGLAELAPDRIAVLISRPATDFARALELRNGVWEVMAYGELAQGRIEILNVARGCLEATLDLAGFPLRLFPDGAVVVYQDDESTGESYHHLYRVSRR